MSKNSIPKSGGGKKSSDRRTSYRDFGCIKSAPELPCFRRTYAATPSDSEADIVTCSKPLSLGKTRSTGSVTQEVTSSSGGGGNFFNRLFARARSRSRDSRRQEALETQCLLDCVSFTESPARTDVINIVTDRATDEPEVEYPAAENRDAARDVESDVQIQRYRSLSSQWSTMDKEVETTTAGSPVSVAAGVTAAGAGSQSERRSSTLPIMQQLRMCPTPPLAVFSSDEDISSVPQTPQHHFKAEDERIDNKDDTINSRVYDVDNDQQIGGGKVTQRDDVDENLGQREDYLIVTTNSSSRSGFKSEKRIAIGQNYRTSYQGDSDAARVAKSETPIPEVTDTKSRRRRAQSKTISPELEEQISRLFASGGGHDQAVSGSKPTVLRSHSLQEPHSSQLYLSPGNIIVRRVPSPLSDNKTITLYSPTKVLNRPKYSRRKHYTIHFGSLPSAMTCAISARDLPESKSGKKTVVLRQTSLHSWSSTLSERDSTSTSTSTTTTTTDDRLTADGSRSCADLPTADLAIHGQVVLRRRSPSRFKSWKHSAELPRTAVSIPVLHFDSQAPKPAVRQPDLYSDCRWMTRLSQMSRDSQEDDEDLPADPDQLPLLLTEVASTDSGIQQDETPTSCESFKLQSHLETTPLLSPLRSSGDSPRKMKRDRPKSECLTVRWADSTEGSTLLSLPEYSADGSTGQSDEAIMEAMGEACQRRRKERPKSDVGPVSGLSAALHRLLRRDYGDMASHSPDGSTGGSGSKVTMRNRRMSTPHPIRSRAAQSVSFPHPCRTHLKRAHSAPEIIDVEGGGLRGHRKQDMFRVSLSTAGDLAVPSHNYSSDDDSEDSLSYGIVSMTTSSLSLQHQAAIEEIFEVNEMTTYAEALWDHVTMDPEELGFRAGDVIEVTDTRDKNWWYGHIADKHGWFPASFVRLRANQVEIIAEDASILVSSQKHSRESVSQSEARTNVVNEIVQAEGEYVRHLRDVIQGYVEKCRRRPEMFPPQTMTAIFSNLTDIYDFSVKFLKDLEANVDKDQPHQSKLGKVFIKHREGFKIYSEYCNNHPTAQEELRKLQKNKVYTHFFEACRLLQDMINLPLEGFLLAPVQKICKYPLQLRELLKYTPRCHGDHDDISNALDTMHGIAVMINERKRKMESIEKLAEWQLTVEDWQGPDLLDHSSELIYSGEMTKVKSAFLHQERVFFLFDHQLIYCKKVLLWRDVLVYKGRINLDNCIIKALADGKDMKNALQIYNDAKNKWHLLYCRTPEERERWFAAFQEERHRVEEDRKNGFNLVEFRSKAHLPQKCVKKHKKKHKVHHSKNVEKQPFVTSEDVTTPEIQDAQDSSRRWMMFNSRKQKM